MTPKSEEALGMRLTIEFGGGGGSLLTVLSMPGSCGAKSQSAMKTLVNSEVRFNR